LGWQGKGNLHVIPQVNLVENVHYLGFGLLELAVKVSQAV
jgi:hypothetical protein